ncbi:MAG: hypothetical protein QME94_11285 [Anaerolineae bacterium]|nr:hypothetical protein [Anaerolineae bacterium]
MRKLRRAVLLAAVGLVVLCLLVAAVSAYANGRLPQRSAVPDRLSQADKARLAEATHVRRTVGEGVWPGWGEADIPLMLYNEQNAFLTGVEHPAAGWVRVPEMNVRGGPWMLVEGDTFAGQAYYYQPVEDGARVIGAFTVMVGDRWVAAFETAEWSRIAFQQDLSRELPPLVRDVFPYALAFDSTIGSDEIYIAALLHESFHAYQGLLQPDRLAAADRTSALEERYPWADPALKSAWQNELDTLQRAVLATLREERIALARQFLQQRQERRTASALPAHLVEYERQQEWLEGLAKYAELSAGLAAAGATYRPLPQALAEIPGFAGYGRYPRFYQGQLREISRLSGRSGGVRFSYGGMAQALLLDDLHPGWKALAMQPGACLEDLLADALAAAAEG